MKAIPALISVCTLTCLSSALGQVAVIDPSNLVQNALSAARSLQQVANQVKSLENEARNLIALGDGSSRDLIDRLSEMERLIASATDLARDLSAARAAMEHLAPPGGAGSTRADRQRLAAAQEAAIRDALAQTLAVQALVSGEIARDQAALARMAARTGVPVVVPRLPSCATAPAARARSSGVWFNSGIDEQLAP